MKFYYFQGTGQEGSEESKSPDHYLDADTSVQQYRDWFSECLKEYGKLIPVKPNISHKELSGLLNKKDAILIFWRPRYFSPQTEFANVPMRVMYLSYGGGMLGLGNIYSNKWLPSAQVELVSTEFQARRLKRVFGGLLTKFYVFPPKVDIEFFIPPSQKERLSARRKYRIKEGQIHLLYAGRLVTTKGFCQLIRTLDLWRIPKAVLTVVGDVDTSQELIFSSSKASHVTFPSFLTNEILQRKRNWLKVRPSAKTKEELRELFWSADILVNPSVHPDENFGIAPREAVSCGLPVVTTNFGGLNPLAESMPWKGLDTYPTHFGSRFSLNQLHRLLLVAIEQYEDYTPENYRRFVLEECSPAIAKSNMKSAIHYLRSRPPERPIDTVSYARRTVRRFFDALGSEIPEIYLDKAQLSSSGLFVYGDSPGSDQMFPVLQGIYSAQNVPPKVKRNTKWRGFFRVSPWEQERAIIEFGFPGPRIKRYSQRAWSSLRKCAFLERPGECFMVPKDRSQIAQVQELVNMGYLVSD